MYLIGGSWNSYLTLPVDQISQPETTFRARQIYQENVSAIIRSIRSDGLDKSQYLTVCIFENECKQEIWPGARGLTVMPNKVSISKVNVDFITSAKPFVVDGSHRLAALQSLRRTSKYPERFVEFACRVIVLPNRSVQHCDLLIKFGVQVNLTSAVIRTMTDWDYVQMIHDRLVFEVKPAPGQMKIDWAERGAKARHMERFRQLVRHTGRGNSFEHIWQLARWCGPLWDALMEAKQGPVSNVKGQWTPIINAKSMYDAFPKTEVVSSEVKIALLNRIAEGNLAWKSLKAQSNSLVSLAGIQQMVAHYMGMDMETLSKNHKDIASHDFLGHYVNSYDQVAQQEKTRSIQEHKKIRPIKEWPLPATLKTALDIAKDRATDSVIILIFCFIFCWLP